MPPYVAFVEGDHDVVFFSEYLGNRKNKCVKSAKVRELNGQIESLRSRCLVSELWRMSKDAQNCSKTYAAIDIPRKSV